MTNNYFFSQGNDNNFKTIEDCYSACKYGSNKIYVDLNKIDEIKTEINSEIKAEINPEIKTEINPEINPEQPVDDVCSLKADPGPCVAYLKRYYFDKNDQKCKIFAFSGCRGKVPT